MPVFFFLLVFLSGFSLNAVESLTAPSDVAALKAFKAAAKPSSIPSWSCLATWNFSAADPCASPRRTFFTCGLSCSPDSSHVTQITLDPAGYSGTLTPFISKLSNLAVLDLADNSFHGPIPASISALSNLQTLTLRANSFSNSLPPSGASNLSTFHTIPSPALFRNPRTRSPT